MKDPSDGRAWEIFASIYRPAIYRAARNAGHQDADAHDIAQAVLTKLSIRSWEFEPNAQRGKFRAWLAVVTRNAIIDHHRNHDAHVADLGQHDRLIPANNELHSTLELEYRREVFHWAAKIVESEFCADAWQSFWRTAVEGVSIEDAANELDRSVGSIYTSRSRIMRRLRQQISLFDETMEDAL